MSNTIDQIDHYAVFGNPITHSLSPKIHSLFAAQSQQSIDYQAILVEEGKFDEAAYHFFQQGGKGFNITVPFKEDAFHYADELTARAKLAGAVNTLSYDGQKCIGDNTDGIGLVNDLTINHDVKLTDKKILILGAGGAVKGVLGPLLEQQPKSITICNRTVSKAESLAKLFNDDKDRVDAQGYEDLGNQSFDIVINGTSSSLNNELLPIPDSIFNENSISYDMMYSKEATVFQKWSLEFGAEKALDGLGMLIEQAAEAFYLWRGVRPETKPVINFFNH